VQRIEAVAQMAVGIHIQRGWPEVGRIAGILPNENDGFRCR
jgi:hypothetical protein